MLMVPLFAPLTLVACNETPARQTWPVSFNTLWISHTKLKISNKFPASKDEEANTRTRWKKGILAKKGQQKWPPPLRKVIKRSHVSLKPRRWSVKIEARLRELYGMNLKKTGSRPCQTKQHSSEEFRVSRGKNDNGIFCTNKMMMASMEHAEVEFTVNMFPIMCFSKKLQNHLSASILTVPTAATANPRACSTCHLWILVL